MMRTTSDVVDQLQEQVVVLRGQFAVERTANDELQRQLNAALKQLGETRAALVDKATLLELIARASPSAAVH